jgi:uncharacterized protein VirK/YbjX
MWGLLTNLGTQREILRLLELRPLDEIAERRPRLAFKYLLHDYLARDFRVPERASCFLHHYRRMHCVLPESALRQILQGDVTLYEIREGCSYFALTLGMPEPTFDREGELSIHLRVDGKVVFNLTFTISPGWVVKSEAPEILLIARIQGTKGCNKQIKLARKVFHDYSPRTVLLAALQGIADAFEIGEVAAVCATNQISYKSKYAATLKRGYDDFFTKLGMVKTAAGFFSCSIPIKSKPLSSFKGRAKYRAKKRHAMRQQIKSACTAFLLEATDQAAYSSSFELSSSTGARPSELRPSTISCSESDCDPAL